MKHACAITSLLLTGCLSADADLGEVEQDVASGSPFAFAHVAANGTLGDRFNSAGSTVTVVHSAIGQYSVTFAGAGLVATTGDGRWGNWQIATEGGASNVHCYLSGLNSSATGARGDVRCMTLGGAQDVDTPFALAFHRYVFPTSAGLPLDAAYTMVDSHGVVDPQFDYNSTGTHNTVTHSSIGTYTVATHGSGNVGGNAIHIVTPTDDPGHQCSVVFWTASATLVQCKDNHGNLVDGAFSYAYSRPTLPRNQQGAYALFNGTTVTQQGGLASLTCGSLSVSGSRSGSIATITVSGDLAPFGGGAFPRISFATPQATYGYCKVLSSFAFGSGPTSASMNVQCYDPTGAIVAVPQFWFAHLTSDTHGPC